MSFRAQSRNLLNIMKTQTNILSILIILLLFSCGQNSSEKQLIGKWYGIENKGYTQMIFYPDSLIISEFDKEVVSWSANNSEIDFLFPILIEDSLGAPQYIEDKVTISYNLSDDKDTLFGNFKSSIVESKLNLLRAENYIDFLNKKYDLTFTLPKDKTVKRIDAIPIYGLNVFIGFSNNKIISKTEISENLNQLQSDVKEFKNNIKPYKRHQIETHKERLDNRFHFRVFADKNISDADITNQLALTIKGDKLLRNQYLLEQFRGTVSDTLPIRIFRIYQDLDEQEFSFMKRHDMVKGKEIETFAKIIYE